MSGVSETEEPSYRRSFQLEVPLDHFRAHVCYDETQIFWALDVVFARVEDRVPHRSDAVESQVLKRNIDVVGSHNRSFLNDL